ncbi:Sialin, partial [Stegodyphus mimosarum]
MTSVPFWALAVGYFSQFWILGFYCTAQPLYMGTILHLDSVTNGLLSSVPPLCRALFACMCGFPADWAVKRGHLSVGFIRKSATLSNSILACLGFLGVSLIGCDPQLNTIFFTAGGLLGDFITFGVCMAGVDIAPNLSGTVSGILSFVGVIPFFIIPAIIGWRTKYERSMAQWNFIYYTTIGVVVATTVLYLVFGTSEPQSWGTDEDEGASEESSDPKRKNSRDTQS